MNQSTAPTTLPTEIRVEQFSPGEVRYVLPRRPLGAYRWLAVAPLVFALIGVCFLWGWFAALGQAPMPVALIFGGIGAFIAFSAVVMPLVLSGAMLFGHSAIEIRRARLFAVEHIGPFRWRRQRPLAEIRRLEVSSLNSKSTAQQRSSIAAESRFAAIRVETERKKPMFGALGYPREWLLPLRMSWLGRPRSLGKIHRPRQHFRQAKPLRQNRSMSPTTLTGANDANSRQAAES